MVPPTPPPTPPIDRMKQLPFANPFAVGVHTCRVFVRIPPPMAAMVGLSNGHGLARKNVLDCQKLMAIAIEKSTLRKEAQIEKEKLEKKLKL